KCLRWADSQASASGARASSRPSRNSPSNIDARREACAGVRASSPSASARSISSASTKSPDRSRRTCSPSVRTRRTPGSSTRPRILLSDQRSSARGSLGASQSSSHSVPRAAARVESASQAKSARVLREAGSGRGCSSQRISSAPSSRIRSRRPVRAGPGGRDRTGIPTPAPTLVAPLDAYAAVKGTPPRCDGSSAPAFRAGKRIVGHSGEANMGTATTSVRQDRPAPPPASPTLDLEALKTRQQAAWSSGDYSIIGTTLQIVGEQLCESLDVRAGARLLDVAAGNGNATLAAARRGCAVVSTDYVSALLERGRERAQAE